MRKRKASVLTKIVVFTLIVVAVLTLINLHGQINQLYARQTALADAVERQADINEAFSHVLERQDDLSIIEHFARERYGFIFPGERVFSRGLD